MFIFNVTAAPGHSPAGFPYQQSGHATPAAQVEADCQSRRGQGPTEHPTFQDVEDFIGKANDRIDILERERSYWRRQCQKKERQLEELSQRTGTMSTSSVVPMGQKGRGKGSKGKGRGKGKPRRTGGGDIPNPFGFYLGMRSPIRTLWTWNSMRW